MADKDNFPVYRKYEDDKVWFKIISQNEFEELKISGNYFSINLYKANILPDRNFIQDLILNLEGVQISGSMYNERLNYCIENLKKIEF